jgi:hypothetical protein
MVSNLVTLCNAACPDVATVPTQLSVNVSGIIGAISNKLTTSGYSLTQSRIWKFVPGSDFEFITGIELTYSSDCCGDPNIVHMYGTVSGSIFSTNIEKKVTKVILKAGSSSKLCDIWFTLGDGSEAKTCNCSTCTTGSTISLTGNLIGLATKFFDGGVTVQLAASTSDISVWVDTVAQCSGCSSFNSFTSTIANKTYMVSNPYTTTEAFTISITSGLLANC